MGRGHAGEGGGGALVPRAAVRVFRPGRSMCPLRVRSPVADAERTDAAPRRLANAKKSRRWNSPRRRPRGARRGGDGDSTSSASRTTTGAWTCTSWRRISPRRRRRRWRRRARWHARRRRVGGDGRGRRRDAIVPSSRPRVAQTTARSCRARETPRDGVRRSRLCRFHSFSRGGIAVLASRSISRRTLATRFALVLRSLAASPAPRARVPGPPARHSPRRPKPRAPPLWSSSLEARSTVFLSPPRAGPRPRPRPSSSPGRRPSRRRFPSRRRPGAERP